MIQSYWTLVNGEWPVFLFFSFFITLISRFGNALRRCLVYSTDFMGLLKGWPKWPCQHSMWWCVALPNSDAPNKRIISIKAVENKLISEDFSQADNAPPYSQNLWVFKPVVTHLGHPGANHTQSYTHTHRVNLFSNSALRTHRCISYSIRQHIHQCCCHMSCM